jgi:hypothetical protein
MNRSNRSLTLVGALGAALLAVQPLHSQTAEPKNAKPSWVDRFFGLKRDHSGGWLFAGYQGDGRSGVYFAVSKDGYHWKLVNDGKPMLRPSQRGEFTRDPSVQRAPDGTFRMVWAWSTGAPAELGYSTSNNLIFWSEQRKLPIAAAIPTAENASSPALYYQPTRKDWLILWSSSVPASGKPDPGNRIYSTTTHDFKNFAPAKLFFDPGYPVADATLLPSKDKAGEFYLLFKDERDGAVGKNIRMAQGSTADGPWQNIGAPIAQSGSEAPAILLLAGGYLAYYDLAADPNQDETSRHYEALLSTDLQHWSYATPKTAFPAGLRHGSFLHIETSDYNLLLDYHQPLNAGSIK